MRKPLLALALAAAALAAAEPAFAVPAFARRYGVACHFCHQGYPKLNPIGQRFKERGFRMEREDAFDAGKWLRSVPVSGRGHANRSFVEDGDGRWTGFLKLISPGNLGTRISYWIDDSFLMQEEDPDKGTVITHLKPDNAWGRVEVIAAGKLYLKGGRLELDLPFTQTRTPHLFSYDIYFANTGFETDNIGDYQDGVEIGASLPEDVRLSVAVVKGRNSELSERFTDEAGKFDRNFFLRTSKRVEKHRFGAFAYFGRNTLALSPTIVWDDDLLRIGGDADLWFERLNVYGVYMYGRNDNSIADAAHPRGTGEALSFSGGFVQGDYHLRDEVALTLRWNFVRKEIPSGLPPVSGASEDHETFSSIFPGIEIWLFEHVKLSFEYGFRNKDRPSFGAVQAEVAF